MPPSLNIRKKLHFVTLIENRNDGFQDVIGFKTFHKDQGAYNALFKYTSLAIDLHKVTVPNFTGIDAMGNCETIERRLRSGLMVAANLNVGPYMINIKIGPRRRKKV